MALSLREVVHKRYSIAGNLSFINDVLGKVKHDVSEEFYRNANGNVSLRLILAAKSFEIDIRPLFRPVDINAMKHVDDPIDLSTYNNVRARAYEIYGVLSHPTPALTMPCDGKWPQVWVNLFKTWLDDGLYP
jgi:hypothetical protein